MELRADVGPLKETDKGSARVPGQPSGIPLPQGGVAGGALGESIRSLFRALDLPLRLGEDLVHGLLCHLLLRSVGLHALLPLLDDVPRPRR